MKSWKDLGIENDSTEALIGDRIKIKKILNELIEVHKCVIKDSKFEKGSGKCLYLQIMYNGEMRVVFTGSYFLIESAKRITQDALPFETIIVEENERFLFKDPSEV